MFRFGLYVIQLKLNLKSYGHILDTAALLRLSLNEVGSSKLMVHHSDNTTEELSSSSLVKCSNSLEVDEGLSLCSSPDEMQSVECHLSNRSAFYRCWISTFNFLFSLHISNCFDYPSSVHARLWAREKVLLRYHSLLVKNYQIQKATVFLVLQRMYSCGLLKWVMCYSLSLNLQKQILFSLNLLAAYFDFPLEISGLSTFPFYVYD